MKLSYLVSLSLLTPSLIAAGFATDEIGLSPTRKSLSKLRRHDASTAVDGDTPKPQRHLAPTSLDEQVQRRLAWVAPTLDASAGTQFPITVGTNAAATLVHEGFIYVTRGSGASLEKVDISTGNQVATLPNLGTTRGLAIYNGYLYVAIDGSPQIRLFDLNLNEQWTLAAPSGSFRDVAFDSAGNMWTVRSNNPNDGNTVQKYAPLATNPVTYSTTPTQSYQCDSLISGTPANYNLCSGFGIAVDCDDNVYVAYEKAVQKMSNDGNFVWALLDTNFAGFTRGVAVDGQRHLYVVDETNAGGGAGTIRVYDADTATAPASEEGSWAVSGYVYHLSFAAEYIYISHWVTGQVTRWWFGSSQPLDDCSAAQGSPAFPQWKIVSPPTFDGDAGVLTFLHGAGDADPNAASVLLKIFAHDATADLDPNANAADACYSNGGDQVGSDIVASVNEDTGNVAGLEITAVLLQDTTSSSGLSDAKTTTIGFAFTNDIKSNLQLYHETDVDINDGKTATIQYCVYMALMRPANANDPDTDPQVVVFEEFALDYDVDIDGTVSLGSAFSVEAGGAETQGVLEEYTVTAQICGTTPATVNQGDDVYICVTAEGPNAASVDAITSLTYSATGLTFAAITDTATDILTSVVCDTDDTCTIVTQIQGAFFPADDTVVTDVVSFTGSATVSVGGRRVLAKIVPGRGLQTTGEKDFATTVTIGGSDEASGSATTTASFAMLAIVAAISLSL